MTRIEIERTVPVVESFRVAKVQGMFDLPHRGKDTFRLAVDIDLDARPWKVGLITGASGTGKTTLARHLWPHEYTVAGLAPWPDEYAIVDGFPSHLTPKGITDLLNAVGLSSAPAWLRPYRVLSTGQQFRADLARALAAPGEGPVVVDEYTSTVDRTVAKAVCVSTARHVARSGRQFVAVTCHKDVTAWLGADWVLDTDAGTFTWGSVHRPPITVEVREGLRQAWPVFRPHHYLSGDLSPSCRVFLAYVTLGDDEQRLAGFFSLLPVMGHAGWWRGHRTVVLPDFQGLGIGNSMIEAVAEQLWVREHKRFRARTSAPAIVAHRRRHPEMWRLAAGPGQVAVTGKTGKNRTTSVGRLTTSWVYIPEQLR